MAEATAADLSPHPSRYNSSRQLFDVLIGEDSALPLIEASSRGDVTTLKTMLVQSTWTEIALQSPHCVYSQDRAPADKSDVRGVLARKMLNLSRAIVKSVEGGHAAAVSTLLDFASRNGVGSSVMGYEIIKKTIENGHATIFEALATVDPRVTTWDLGPAHTPLDLAMLRRQPDIVAVILQLNAGRDARKMTNKPDGSFMMSLLSRSARNPRMLELLLQHGTPVAESGALHTAAEGGNLDAMRLLMQYGADVNERLPKNTFPRRFSPSLLASWTPLHFAASSGREDAIKLLESKGAQTDVADENGKTPVQLLMEHNEGSDPDKKAT
jgi:ankyrin repeat protein